jgi:4-amino-4-deoxy-L-arabinose transferase-like glycosyltransferase
MRLNNFPKTRGDKPFASQNAVQNPRFLVYFLIAAGLVLRLKYYLDNPSPWLDEAALVLTIIRRSFSDIFSGNNYCPHLPTAPAGFLMLEKGAMQIFGTHELVLRAFPFLCSVVSLFLFFVLAKKSAGDSVAPWALALFALAGPLARYAGEVKPYSCDVLIAVILCLLADYMSKKEMRPWRVICLGFAGGAALWFSYTSIFVLGGILLTLLISGLMQKRYSRCVSFGLAACFWALSFLALYVFEMKQISQNKIYYAIWAKAFLPWTAGLGGILLWLKNSFLSLFGDTMGFAWTYLAAGLFLYRFFCRRALGGRRCVTTKERG